jgi:DNA-binding NarL/FixJ family response regulator
LVDHRPDLLRGASRLLEAKARSSWAANSEQAASLIAELHRHVALVDGLLGAESGFDLVRGLASAPESAGSRASLISTRDDADFVELIATSPAIGFLPKSDLSATAIHCLLTGFGTMPMMRVLVVISPPVPPW